MDVCKGHLPLPDVHFYSGEKTSGNIEFYIIRNYLPQLQDIAGPALNMYRAIILQVNRWRNVYVPI